MALAMAASRYSRRDCGSHRTRALQPARDVAGGGARGDGDVPLTLCYAVANPAQGTLTYANAGHPHAFLVSTGIGRVTRLDATRPPLGLGGGGRGARAAVRTWQGRFCVCQRTVSRMRGADGERFGEAARAEPRGQPEAVPRGIFSKRCSPISPHLPDGAPANDDRTLVCSRFETARPAFSSVIRRFWRRIVDAARSPAWRDPSLKLGQGGAP